MSSLFGWPLGRKDPGAPKPATIEAIYGVIVAQARAPAFYQDFGVPDTVDGRFDMVLLHLWMALARLKAMPEGGPWAQALFDHFCSDMDANLREMGVGDTTVPKRMRAFGEAFYGRAKAYDLALEDGPAALAQAIARNVLGEPEAAQGVALANYVAQALEALNRTDDDTLRQGAWPFPAP